MKEYEENNYLNELYQISYLPYYMEDKREDYLEYKRNYPYIPWVDVITYVNIGLNRPFYQGIQQIENPDSLQVFVNKYNQLCEDYMPKDLEQINPVFNPEGLLLRRAARLAFEQMCSDAYGEGIFLRAISTFRSYYYQWKVYLNNINQYIPFHEYQAVRDKVSARPGHSEHQTGLAVDINELEQTFELTKEAKWLSENAYRYGFILRYPKGKEAITGYDYEPWHYRYVGKDLAVSVYDSSLTYDEFYTRYLM